MSYILDALKRSEQDRHQGELTHATIDTIMMPKKPVRHHWWPYVLIVVLCVNIFVFLYFQFPMNTTESENKAMAASNEAQTHTQVSLESKLEMNAYQSAPQHTTEKPLPAHLMQTPKLVKRYDVSQLAKSTKAQEAGGVTLNSGGYEVIRPKNYSENSRPAKMPKTHKAPKLKIPVNHIPEQPKARQDRGVTTLTSKNIERQTVKQGNEINFDAVSHINDIELSFQKQIPDIRFNSHIYSLNPSDRRVMINDLYLREGQDFSGVMIETIGEFYVILSKQSQRFKIPVLRDWYSP